MAAILTFLSSLVTNLQTIGNIYARFLTAISEKDLNKLHNDLSASILLGFGAVSERKLNTSDIYV